MKSITTEGQQADASATEVFLMSCSVGAVLGWLKAQCHSTRTLAASAGAAVAAAPLMARAMTIETGSSITVAGGEEALFYTWILLATIITLVLTVVLREAPRI